MFETGHGIGTIKIKSGETIASNYFDSLSRIAKLVPEIFTKVVVCGGVARQSRDAGEVVPVADLCEVLKCFEGNQKIALSYKTG